MRVIRDIKTSFEISKVLDFLFCESVAAVKRMEDEEEEEVIVDRSFARLGWSGRVSVERIQIESR